MAQVFLSYDHEDLPVALAIAAALEKAGHTVWYDRHVHGGAQYSRKIEQALDAADAVVVLWSERSLDSAWVRDEAAEGRDRGKLVPLSIGGVTPPIGFRQFQTIDLGSWKGRGKVPHLANLLGGIAAQANEQQPLADAIRPKSRGAAPALRPRGILLAAAIAILLAVGVAAWWFQGRSELPAVVVAAADRSPGSQAAASDLYVKLGSLAHVGKGRWQLIDDGGGTTPDLIFRTADRSAEGEARANLVLLDGKNVLLWSREFAFPGNAVADLRQTLSLTAGRVLDCALESRQAGDLRLQHFKIFLDGCALMAESGMDDPSKVLGMMRSVIAAEPEFVPAWRRILSLDTQTFDLAGFGQGDRPAAVQVLKRDIAAARRIDPDLPEIRLAEMKLLPPTAFGARFKLLSEAAAAAPQDANVHDLMSSAALSVGRMFEGVQSARRAAELDPLSPGLTTALIMALAYAAQLDEARAELARAERVWTGTAAFRDAQWAFHLRFGDATRARQVAPPVLGVGLDLYLDARDKRSDAAINRFITHILRERSGEVSDGAYGGVLQALGEFNRVDDAFAWLARSPTEMVAEASYLLFRPGMAEVRKDRRFMAVAGRIGLVEYWQQSGRWPDFCSEAGLSYDCRTEAAKYAR